MHARNSQKPTWPWPLTYGYNDSINRVLEIAKLHVVHNFIELRTAVHKLSCAKSFDDAENYAAVASAGSSEAENGVININYDPFHVRWKKFGELWSISKKVYAANVYPPKMNTARAV